MDNITRREAMGTMAAGGAALFLPVLPTPATAPEKKIIPLSYGKEFKGATRAQNLLYELRFPFLAVMQLTICTDHIDRVKTEMLDMKNRFNVKNRNFDADVEFVRSMHQRFVNVTKNVVWVRSDGTEESNNDMVWMAICLSLSRDIDLIATIDRLYSKESPTKT